MKLQKGGGLLPISKVYFNDYVEKIKLDALLKTDVDDSPENLTR